MLENQHQHEDDEMPVIHLELDNGTSEDCAVISIFGVEGYDYDYIALVPVQDLESEEESRLLLYRFTEEDDETARLDNIEDDTEYKAVTDTFDSFLEEEDN